MNPGLDDLRERVARAAAAGAFLGTSSWKYPGWLGSLYDQSRYEWRGKFALSRFERDCLREYATVFPTVCVDGAYYQFPTRASLEKMVAQVPPGFRFSFKATDEITVPRFPRLPRFGPRAGRENPHFLDADLFANAFLAPCETIRDFVGVIIFEFSRLGPPAFERGRDFVAALGGFLQRLPAGWRYGIEIRNPSFLHPDYFALLSAHGVSHVFNSWTAMPPIGEQWKTEGALTAPDFAAARFLLKPGRAYDEAVKQFSPYREIQEICAEARETGAAMIQEAAGSKRRSLFIYVNNRLEGNALESIRAMLRISGI